MFTKKEIRPDQKNQILHDQDEILIKKIEQTFIIL
jgi:hypothetical protein